MEMNGALMVIYGDLGGNLSHEDIPKTIGFDTEMVE